MKYIIIGQDLDSQIMWVLPGLFDNKLVAETARDKNQRIEIHPNRYRYEIAEIASTKTLDDLAGVQSVPFAYADTDSLHSDRRTEEFTEAELFPGLGDQEYYFVTCPECGSMVLPTFTERHVAWHNKLLP